MRVANLALDQPMTYWAELYVKPLTVKDSDDCQSKPASPRHGDTRLSDYLLVGRLLAGKTLRDFDGKPGAQLIEQLAQKWRFDRRQRSKKPRPDVAPPPKPLADQTVRLRLTALQRLIRFAKSNLPADAHFQLPAMDELFEFKLPPAHGNPRKREPSDAEFGRLLQHFEPDSEFGHFLRVIDESGCRLSEVRNAMGSAVHFFTISDQVIGGYLTLTDHKTRDAIGTREVPLSPFAAKILNDRKLRFGKGRLFPGLRSKDKICKDFDEACDKLTIVDLLIKDSRRAFINRNKYCVAQVDLLNIVGQSSLLDASNVTASERNMLDAVGHTSIQTTSGYAKPRLAELAQVFTQTSRWSRVAALMQPKSYTTSEADAPDVAALQRLLADTLAKLARVGVTALLA